MQESRPGSAGLECTSLTPHLPCRPPSLRAGSHRQPPHAHRPPAARRPAPPAAPARARAAPSKTATVGMTTRQDRASALGLTYTGPAASAEPSWGRSYSRSASREGSSGLATGDTPRPVGRGEVESSHALTRRVWLGRAGREPEPLSQQQHRCRREPFAEPVAQPGRQRARGDHRRARGQRAACEGARPQKDEKDALRKG